MHHAINVCVALVDQELEVYGPFWGGVEQGEGGHEVSVEAVEVAGGSYEEVAGGCQLGLW